MEQHEIDKKVIFLDVDGTIVNEEGKIPDSARLAIQQAKERGHKLVVCSGRSRFQIYSELLELGFSGVIGGAGVSVETEEGEIFHAHIDEEHRKSSYEYMERNGFLFCYQADNGVVINQRCCAAMQQRLRDIGMSEEQMEKLTGTIHLTEEPWRNEKSEKIIYYEAPFPVEKVHADMEPYFDAVAISLSGMDEFAGEVGINGINKATGMEIYLKHVGISRENTIAVGDGPNDLQMMEYAGIGVAMGNAREEVKRLADMVTDHIDENGLYNAFVRLGLIGEA